ncbi:hypothetical protein WJ06_03100 [Burkholderia cepacia]|nr:hypothetical protein WJ06_03100 [Burkholderia cepacia]
MKSCIFISITGEFTRSPTSQFIAHALKRTPARHREDLDLGGSFEVVEIVKCRGNRRARDYHAVVLEHQDTLGRQRGGNPVSFLFAECKSSVFRLITVVCNAIEKAKAVLMAHFEAKAVERRQCRGIRHVRMKYACGIRRGAMNSGMDVERGFLDSSDSVDYRAGGIDEQQISRSDLFEAESERIDQIRFPTAREQETEMVACALVEAEARGDAKCRGQIVASIRELIGLRSRKKIGGVCHGVVQCKYAYAIPLQCSESNLHGYMYTLKRG